MSIKNLVLCSIAVLILLATNGCYTVFRHKTFDGKPPENMSVRTMDSFSGDIAFKSCQYGRWTYYLTNPWWHESLWTSNDTDDESVESDENEEMISGGQAIDIPPLAPQAIAHPIPISGTPNPSSVSSNEKTSDVRYKDSNSDKTETTTLNTATKGKKEGHKPGRRGGSGGR